MRLYKVFSLILLTWLLSGFALAKEMQIIVKMTDIQAEKRSEARGDELYFNITQYSNFKDKLESRIPEYPMHWLSKQLTSLKNVVLWQGELKERERIRLVLSLLDQDLQPWDLDDAIGAAEVHLLNQKGKLKIQWGVPKFDKNNKEVEMLKRAVPQRYVFKGDGSRYDVAFSVEHK